MLRIEWPGQMSIAETDCHGFYLFFDCVNMSQVNLTSKIYPLGDVNYETCGDKCNKIKESVVIASSLLNDIVENAMDIAINSTANSTQTRKMNVIDEVQDDLGDACPEIRDIIDGLSKINVGKNILSTTSNPEEPVNLDAEMKRLLGEMMSPPFEIINYDSLPRKDGVGDQAPEDNSSLVQQPEREPLEVVVPADNAKPVEKKSRVTDLVMNSKKVLGNLLDDVERKRLEEWEESNEHIIRVIELQAKKKKEMHASDIEPALFPLPPDDSEDDLLPKPEEASMENVDLGRSPKGECSPIKDQEAAQSSVSPCSSNNLSCSKSYTKKKKWNFSLKLFGFRKNRNKNKPEEDTSN